GGLQLFHEHLGFDRSEGLFQDLADKLISLGEDARFRVDDRGKVLNHLHNGGAGYMAKLGHALTDFLYLVVVQMFEYLGGNVVTKIEEQYGGFIGTCHNIPVICGINSLNLLPTS